MDKNPSAPHGAQEPIAMAGTYTSLIYHLVFSTKHRLPVISPELRDRLVPYMGGIIRGEGGVLEDGNAVADHVHLLVRWMPDVTISDLLKTVKSKSSGWVHRNHPTVKDFWWQEGYGAFSVSESQTDHVRSYIRKCIIENRISKRSSWRFCTFTK